MSDTSHSPDYRSAGEIVKELRTARGLTRSQLAAQAGCSYNLIGAIERDKRKLTVASARSIADALGVPLDVFSSTRLFRRHLKILRTEVRPPQTTAA